MVSHGVERVALFFLCMNGPRGKAPSGGVRRGGAPCRMKCSLHSCTGPEVRLYCASYMLPTLRLSVKNCFMYTFCYVKDAFLLFCILCSSSPPVTPLQREL